MTNAERKILIEKESKLWESLTCKRYLALLENCERGCGYFEANLVVDEIPAVSAKRLAWFHVNELLLMFDIVPERTDISKDYSDRYYRYSQGIDAD